MSSVAGGAETEPGGAQIEYPAAETDVDGAQIAFPVAETDVGGAQWDALGTAVGRAAGHPVAVTGSGDAQWDAFCTAVGRAAGHPSSSEAAGARRHDVLGTAVCCAASRAVGLGRRAKRSQVRLERTEAGSLDSFGNDAFLSCRIESHDHGSHVSPLHSIICVLITGET